MMYSRGSYIPFENWQCALGASAGSSALCPSKSFFKQRLLDRPLSNKPRPFLTSYGPGRTLVCHGAKHMECAQMPSRFSRTRHTGLSQISLHRRNGNTKISRDGLTRFSSSVQALPCISKACLGATWSITLWDNWEYLIRHESQLAIDAIN